MAISMKKWVDIKSATLPAGASDRELILRLITKSSGISEKVERDTVYEMESADEVAAYFGSTSDEYKIAAKYFSYVSLSATAPTKISFWRPGRYQTTTESGGIVYTDDTITTTLTKMVDTSDNFATFMFVYGDNYSQFGNAEFKEAATWCGTQDSKYRFVVPVKLASLATQTGSITWEKVSGADNYLKDFAQTGVTAVLDDDFVALSHIDDSGSTVVDKAANTTTYPGWLTCALLASTKYSRQNSTIIQEFKALDSANMNVTCSCDSLYKILTELNVNFYGQTQKAGKLIAFYMEGYNLDGTDTSVYDNEIWLKDRVTTEVFNRFVKCNKVPAGTIGRAMIKAAIQGVISEGLNNLAVQPEKTIEDSDKAAIIQNTGATDAPTQIYTNGYYLDVQDGDTEIVGKAKRRVVDYILYYSTGEGIRKVTGSHVLV